MALDAGGRVPLGQAGAPRLGQRASYDVPQPSGTR